MGLDDLRCLRELLLRLFGLMSSHGKGFSVRRRSNDGSTSSCPVICVSVVKVGCSHSLSNSKTSGKRSASETYALTSLPCVESEARRGHDGKAHERWLVLEEDLRGLRSTRESAGDGVIEGRLKDIGEDTGEVDGEVLQDILRGGSQQSFECRA